MVNEVEDGEQKGEKWTTSGFPSPERVASVVDIGCSSEATTDGEQVNRIVLPERLGGRNWGAL